jgi:5-methylcytosine-specific restriction endonuclease McrA
MSTIEARRRASRAYYQRNKEKCADACKRWEKNNPDKVSAKYRRYRANHPKLHREAVRRWRGDHRENVKAWLKKRRATKAGCLVNDLTAIQWSRLKKHYGGCCAYCFVYVGYQRLTQDHIIPLSRGGNHTLSNVAPCCRSCNSRKQSKTLAEWLGT